MTPQPGTDSLFLSGSAPTFDIEARRLGRGLRHVCGVDEAGRGPLAGPVVAAAVVLDPERIPAGLDDSKKLSRPVREALFLEIAASADIAWASVPAAEIDRLNIRGATLAAMTAAVAALARRADCALIDGRDVPPGLAGIGTAIVGGDATSLSIAAASIVAKVVRDRLMARACLAFPDYGFSTHAGYGTPRHLEALRAHGPCPLHRMSFAPVRRAAVGRAAA